RLQRPTFGTLLGKAAIVNHRGFHAALGGGSECGQDALVAEAEDRDIRLFRKLGGARVAGAVEDARVIRVDRKDPAGKPDTFERGNDPTARCRLVGGPNYRDRFRSEQRVEPHRPHALSNRYPSSLAASPMQRKRRLGVAAAPRWGLDHNQPIKEIANFLCSTRSEVRQRIAEIREADEIGDPSLLNDGITALRLKPTETPASRWP